MKIAKAIYDIEEATSTAFGLILDQKVKKLTLSLSLMDNFGLHDLVSIALVLN